MMHFESVIFNGIAAQEEAELLKEQRLSERNGRTKAEVRVFGLLYYV